ncbi:hypothetical protein MMC27_003321 [Xylographa pallens]|nr:hypothetical protein [Xylographa pallens]
MAGQHELLTSNDKLETHTMTTSTITTLSYPPSSTTFAFPPSHSFPPFWTIQPTLSTRAAQFRKWAALILAYCQHQRLFSLTLTDALQTPLFHNSALRKRLTLGEAREIIDWMCSKDGDGRAEWIGAGEGRSKERAWIWWRSVDEWGEEIREWVRWSFLCFWACERDLKDLVALDEILPGKRALTLFPTQVEATGQKNTVLTLYELAEGESTTGQGKASSSDDPILTALRLPWSGPGGATARAGRISEAR